MCDHYYTARPVAGHAESKFSTSLRGMDFRFVTDTAVFSKSRVDFGTTLLIEAMEILPEDVVLDVGCGYGPLGLVSARMAHRGFVYMVDVNERAVDLTRRNIAENRIKNAEVRTGSGVEPVKEIRFDKVLTNPPIRAGKAVVYQMIEGVYEVLKEGGSLWVVIQTKQGAPSMKKKLAELFGNVSDVARQAGYHVLTATRG